jgi:hypothetical protein
MYVGLNDIILKKKKVRDGVYAYLTQGGVIINKQSYIGYSLTEAIAKFRRDFPAYQKRK